MDILKHTAHRPWPLPSGPWIMKQEWHDLLFAHWTVPVEVLRRLIPRALEIDTFGGQAWLGVVPFRMSGVRMHGAPAVPGFSRFPELNVRTYVVRDGKPGVWFFSLDAASAVAAAIARASLRLPYCYARISRGATGERQTYEVARVVPAAPAGLSASWRIAGEAAPARPGTGPHSRPVRCCYWPAGRPAAAVRPGRRSWPAGCRTRSSRCKA